MNSNTYCGDVVQPSAKINWMISLSLCCSLFQYLHQDPGHYFRNMMLPTYTATWPNLIRNPFTYPRASLFCFCIVLPTAGLQNAPVTGVEDVDGYNLRVTSPKLVGVPLFSCFFLILLCDNSRSHHVSSKATVKISKHFFHESTFRN